MDTAFLGLSLAVSLFVFILAVILLWVISSTPSLHQKRDVPVPPRPSTRPPTHSPTPVLTSTPTTSRPPLFIPPPITTIGPTTTTPFPPTTATPPVTTMAPTTIPVPVDDSLVVRVENVAGADSVAFAVHVFAHGPDGGKLHEQVIPYKTGSDFFRFPRGSSLDITGYFPFNPCTGGRAGRHVKYTLNYDDLVPEAENSRQVIVGVDKKTCKKTIPFCYFIAFTKGVRPGVDGTQQDCR